ncbi:hypothetical protein N9E97_02655 [Planktomarina sp.]|jgi:hypothetical protein|nr:hypothetical protein [Planktomarina sp.]
MNILRATLFAVAVLAPFMAFAHEAPIRVVVLGEDSDKNAVSRSSEIYTRVVAELQQSLIRENITVIDEDMIAVKLGFSYNEDRTKQELIQTLSIANETTDATVRSRLGVVFAIFPNIQEMSMTRKLTVRVRGQVYDLKTLRALSSFEVSAPETVTLPKKASMCNDMCVVEKAGEVSRELARELGAVLSQKLHIVIEDSAYSGSTTGSASGGDGVLESVYTLEFNLMKNSDVLRAVRALEASDVREIELMKSNNTQRIYSVTTNKDLGDLEERIMMLLLDLGVDIDRLRFSSFGTKLSIEAL